MKPREEGGVVDSKLNVYGVDGLKVAGACGIGCIVYPMSDSCLDLSIPPSNVAAVREASLCLTWHII